MPHGSDQVEPQQNQEQWWDVGIHSLLHSTSLVGETQSCMDEEGGVWYEVEGWETVDSVVHHGQ